MDHGKLIQEALIARRAAYAPYSHFQVGAAVLCGDGRVFHGCNIENSSYGLCNCAERTALFSAIAAGRAPGDFSALAVVGQSEGPISPCGACRQVMLELGDAGMLVIRPSCLPRSLSAAHVRRASAHRQHSLRLRKRNDVQLAINDPGDLGVKRKVAALFGPDLPKPRHRPAGGTDHQPFAKAGSGGEAG